MIDRKPSSSRSRSASAGGSRTGGRKVKSGPTRPVPSASKVAPEKAAPLPSAAMEGMLAVRPDKGINPRSRLDLSLAGLSGIIEPLSILVGLAAGWQLCGMRMIVAAALDPLPATTIMVVAIALLAAALGPWFPERIVLWITRMVVKRTRIHAGPVGDFSGTFWMLRAARERDPATHWLAVSVLSTVAALAALLTLALSGPVIQLYHYFLERFFWTSTTLAFLEWAGVSLFLGSSWALNGLVISTLWSVWGAGQVAPRHSVGVPTGLITGFTLAAWTHEIWVNGGLSGGQSYMLGILPMFILAGVAAKRSQQLDFPPRQPLVADNATPEFSASAEGLIWISLVTWGVATAWAVQGWIACRGMITPHHSPALELAGFLFVIGLGFLLLSNKNCRHGGTASGCGMALWAAGLGIAATATCMAFWPAGHLAGLLQALCIGWPIGYALRYTKRAWLARVGSETLGHEQLLSAVFGGLGIGLLSGYFWVGPKLGAMGVLSAGALLLLAWGGLLQIYVNDRPVRIQHQRLALVFISLAGAIALLPIDARKWAEYRRGRAQSAPVGVQLDWPGADVPLLGRRVALIGVSADEALMWPASQMTNVEVMPLASSWSSARPPVHLSNHVISWGDSALRRFRYDRSLYNLIYQRCRSAPCLTRFAEYSDEWLVLLAAHVASGGQVIVDVPINGLNAEAVGVIAATFRQAMPGPVGWTLVQTEQTYLRLMALMGDRAHSIPSLKGLWMPLDRILTEDGRPHSIRRDRITQRLSIKGLKPVAWEDMLKP